MRVRWVVAAAAGAAAIVAASANARSRAPQHVGVARCDAGGRAVYSFGMNTHGQLGLGHEKAVLVPTRVVALDAENVTAVAAGGNMTAVINDRGELLTWGMGRDFALGHNDDVSDALPRAVEFFAQNGIRVRAIAVGKQHMLALAEDGRVFSWGSPMGGVLGHGDSARQPVPKAIAALSGVKVVLVAAGAVHSMVSSAAQRVLAWGSRSTGRTGVVQKAQERAERQMQKNVPHEVPALADVVAIACGEGHFVVADAAGQVFTWGNDEFGQLGHGSRHENDVEVPKPVRALRGKKVVAVAAGSYHSAVVTEAGEVFTWGNNKDGELGHGNNLDSVIPRPVTMPDGAEVAQIACGEGHTVAVTRAGGVFAFGKGRDGQLGQGEVASRALPVRVALPAPAIGVACGENHTVILARAPVA